MRHGGSDRHADDEEASRRVEGWARSVLQDAGAIRECEEHDWMKDRADPRARDRARRIAREEPAFGLSPDEAIAAIDDILRLNR